MRKLTLTEEDGSVVEFVEASAAPTEVVDLKPGESLEVEEAPETPAA